MAVCHTGGQEKHYSTEIDKDSFAKTTNKIAEKEYPRDQRGKTHVSNAQLDQFNSLQISMKYNFYACAIISFAPLETAAGSVLAPRMVFLDASTS